MTRTINDITESFISNLKANNSPLNDFNPSSVNSTLIRSIAALQLEQDILLEELQNNIYLSKSPGIYLDNKVKDFGVTRKLATFASGSILAKNSLGLNIGAILTDLNTNNQYIITSSNSVLNKFGEASYLIKSTSTGSRFNLPANSKLTYVQNTSISIVVGNIRLDNLSVIGDISGGTDLESDSKLLNRFLYTILDTRYSTPNAIKSFLLSQSNISFVSIDNPFPGHLIIWFESSNILTNSDISNLKQSIQNELAAGITFDFLPIQRQYIDLNVLINTIIKTKDDVSNKLTADINTWFDNLSVNESFDPNVLLNYLNSVNFSFISNISFRDKTSPVVCLPDNLISINSLLFTFNNT